jgi:hypothetical protein
MEYMALLKTRKALIRMPERPRSEVSIVLKEVNHLQRLRTP